MTSEGTLPVTNQDWLEWITAHDEQWRQDLRDSRQKRKVISHRLKPSQELLKHSHGCSRLQPVPARTSVKSWGRKLLQEKHGLFCLQWNEYKRVFFFCGLLGKGFALDLQQLGPLAFSLNISSPLRPKLTNFVNLLDEWPPHNEDDVSLYKMEVEGGFLTKAGDKLELQVSGVELVELRRRKRRAYDSEDVEDFSDLDNNCDFIAWRDSDDIDVQSAAETDAEAELEQEQEEEAAAAAGLEEVEAEGPDSEDKVPGSNVVSEYSCGYFTLEDYHKRGRGPDAKIRVRPRWHGDTEDSLGKTDLSKTLHILKYDVNLDEPKRTYICLRSWSLHRASRGNWLNRCRERQQWFHGEVHSLKHAVAALRQPPGTTGSETADSLIKLWAPQILA